MPPSVRILRSHRLLVFPIPLLNVHTYVKRFSLSLSILHFTHSFPILYRVDIEGHLREMVYFNERGHGERLNYRLSILVIHDE